MTREHTAQGEQYHDYGDVTNRRPQLIPYEQHEKKDGGDPAGEHRQHKGRKNSDAQGAIKTAFAPISMSTRCARNHWLRPEGSA